MERSSFDQATARQAFAGPGQDTRQWVTWGLVAPDTPDAPSVQFADTDGTVLPYPVVLVQLVETGITVACRVGGHSAGAGEGEWHPFVAGDEVLVAIPNGDERAGCTIISRMNQSLDTFPTSVAGNDPSKNNFGFKRVRTPYVFETASSYLVRSALTGAFFAIDTTGAITLTAGDGDYLTISPDIVGLMLADTTCQVMIDKKTSQVRLQAKGTTVVLDDQASALLTAGTLSLLTSGGGYSAGHAITTEQVATILYALATLIPGPWVGAAILTQLQGPAWAAAASQAITPPTAKAIAGALAATAPDPTGLKPGIGRPGLLF